MKIFKKLIKYLEDSEPSNTELTPEEMKKVFDGIKSRKDWGGSGGGANYYNEGCPYPLVYDGAAEIALQHLKKIGYTPEQYKWYYENKNL